MVVREQGDQIGCLFACWAIVYFGRLFTLGSSLKITDVGHFWATFFHGKMFALNLTKMAWATFGAIVFIT
jgi:hypothetical protein